MQEQLMRGKWNKIRRTTIALFLAVTVTFGIVGDTTKVLAQTEPTFDSQFFSGNDIFFYDPTYQAVCAGGGLVGGSTKEKIWNFLIANSLSPEQAAGLMGNMQQESNFLPVNWQGGESSNLWDDGGSKGWGLVQWDSGRRFSPPNGGVLGTLREEKPHLEKYTQYKYESIGEPNEEFPQADFDEMLLFLLDYMMQESMNRPVTAHQFEGSADKEWDRMKEQPTLRDATLFWERNFEVSGDGDDPAALQRRVDYAQTIFDEFKDNLSAAGSGTTGCAAAGDLQELTLAYAWPERHTAPFPQPMPAYAEAVSTAQDEGRYVGGCASNGECKPGIDCGGFVTLLITNSGHDPNYNSGQGNTASQLAWLRDESNGWRRIGRGGEFDPAELRPGDVAIYNSGSQGHTFVYVGREMVEMGFGGNGSEPGIASASIGPNSWRAPMAGGETPADSSFEWFTKG
jgi:hypothetical protein